MPPTIWLLSAYRSDSHAYWADGLVKNHPEFDWQLFELPGRHFAWRIRSNPLSWLDRMIDALGSKTPDLILATSMVDLATLKGLHPALSKVPSVYYFHENQLAYPIIPGQVQSIEPAMVQVYGALAASQLLFNSKYNQDSFLSGIDALTRRLPDGIPDGISTRLQIKSGVLPVAVEPLSSAADRRASAKRAPPLIVWNHRWEHDKQPDRFAEAMIDLANAGEDFQLALLGPRSATAHPALSQLQHALSDRIVVNGFVARADYASWLRRADIVISTAIHEFQGISLLEAVSAGAWPLVPDDLCYPEQYPQACRYQPGSIQDLVSRLRSALHAVDRTAPDIRAWLAPRLRPAWTRMLQASVGGSASLQPGEELR